MASYPQPGLLQMKQERLVTASRIGMAALCIALLLSVSVEYAAIARDDGMDVLSTPAASERLIVPVFVPGRMSLSPAVQEPEILTSLPESTVAPEMRNQAVPIRVDAEANLPPEDRRELPRRSTTLLDVQTPPAPAIVATPATPLSEDLQIPKGKVLVINQAAQRLHVFEDGVEVRILPISSGLYPLYTPAHRGYVGHYAPTLYGYGSLADHAWYLFRAGGNIYIHGAPYQLENGVKVYKELEFIGAEPVSHGCIRLLPEDAEWLRDWNPAGVLFIVTPPDLSRR